MLDYSAGHISTEEAAELIGALQAEVGRDRHHLSCRGPISSSIDMERGRCGCVLYATPRN